jgi:hypothetical protein
MKFAEKMAEFMKRYHYRPSELGRAALNDPNFVNKVLLGRRSPTERIMLQVEKWMDQGPEVHAPEKRKPVRVAKPPLAQRAGDWPTAAIIWTAREDKLIRNMIQRGKDWDAIGAKLGVSPRSARRRAADIGVAPLPGPRPKP